MHYREKRSEPVELAFKRMKSITGLGHLPKWAETSTRAWMHGKLLIAMLVERLLDEAEAVSPWDTDWTPRRCRWREMGFPYRELCSAISPPLGLTRSLDRWPQVARGSVETPRKRKRKILFEVNAYGTPSSKPPGT